MLSELLAAINPVHAAYAVMVFGVMLCFLFSGRHKREIRGAADHFAIPFVELSNYICPEPTTSGIAVENRGGGRICGLPIEKQPGTIRSVMRRANEEVPVQLFARMVEAANEMESLTRKSRTDREQFGEPIQELLLMTHTFLTGCENPKNISSPEKKRQFDSFLQDQLTHRMVLLKRISGGLSEEFMQLNQAYADEMEKQELEEREKRQKKEKRT
ncbi:MAG: hypothetical protein LUE86_13310 [Clostridiales bacterium]|nr:hypothetical protein [Clostridiales bacterium]